MANITNKGAPIDRKSCAYCDSPRHSTWAHEEYFRYHPKAASPVDWKMLSFWNPASCLPPKERETKGQNWDCSGRLWVRVKAVFAKNKETDEERMAHPAYTDIGRCVWPKKPIAFHPVPKKNPDAVVSNPATIVEWGPDEPFFEVNGKRVDAEAWLYLIEPIPPGEEIPQVITGSLGTNIIFVEAA